MAMEHGRGHPALPSQAPVPSGYLFKAGKALLLRLDKLGGHRPLWNPSGKSPCSWQWATPSWLCLFRENCSNKAQPRRAVRADTWPHPSETLVRWLSLLIDKPVALLERKQGFPCWHVHLWSECGCAVSPVCPPLLLMPPGCRAASWHVRKHWV